MKKKKKACLHPHADFLDLFHHNFFFSGFFFFFALTLVCTASNIFIEKKEVFWTTHASPDISNNSTICTLEKALNKYTLCAYHIVTFHILLVYLSYPAWLLRTAVEKQIIKKKCKRMGKCESEIGQNSNDWILTSTCWKWNSTEFQLPSTQPKSDTHLHFFPHEIPLLAAYSSYRKLQNYMKSFSLKIIRKSVEGDTVGVVMSPKAEKKLWTCFADFSSADYKRFTHNLSIQSPENLISSIKILVRICVAWQKMACLFILERKATILFIFRFHFYV